MSISVGRPRVRPLRGDSGDRAAVSVVIPTFNCARLLRHAVVSAVEQTAPLREIIVVDDGSTDDAADAIASQGPSITYIRQPNNGPSAARNRGAEAASGLWLAFLDADDRWMPDKIRQQLDAAEESPDAGLVYTATSLVYPDGARRARNAVPPAKLWPLLRYRNCLTDSTVLVRRNVFLQHGGFNGSLRICEDWDLWTRIRANHSFTYVPDPLCSYGIRAGSLSNNIDQTLTDAMAIIEPTLLMGLSGVRGGSGVAAFWPRSCSARRSRRSKPGRRCARGRCCGDPPHGPRRISCWNAGAKWSRCSWGRGATDASPTP